VPCTEQYRLRAHGAARRFSSAWSATRASSPHAPITVPSLRRERFPGAPAILTPPPRPVVSVPGSGRQPDAPDPAYLGHPPLGQPVGGHGGRHAFLLGPREGPPGRNREPFRARPCPLQVG